MKEQVENLEIKDKSKPIVSYCRTGVSATAVYFALEELGFTNIRLYDGSWSEFGTREDTKEFA